MRPSWFKISAILASLWLVVGGLLWWLHELQPSAEKVVAFSKTHSVAGQNEAERARRLQAVAEEFLRLDVDARGDLLASRELEPWWKELSLLERRTFRMGIFPQSRQLIDTFDKLEPDRRRVRVKQILESVKKRMDGVPKQFDQSDRIMQMVDKGGIKSLFESVFLDVDYETLVLFHQLERYFVWRR